MQLRILGFRQTCSALIEVKVSRSDFACDRLKPERSAGGVGVYRFYLCPTGLIRVEELPAKWGLLYADGRKIEAVVKPVGNLWPPLKPSFPGADIDDWGEFQHESSAELERNALYSIARRLHAGHAV